MKKHNMSPVPALLFLFLPFLAGGCLLIRMSRTFTEEDQATATVRTRKIYQFENVLERKTPFIHLKKTFYKVQDSSGNSTFYVYDVLTLDHGSFDIEEKLFMIIDGKSFALKGELQVPENFIATSTDTETIMTADSSEVEVVTDYSRNQWKHYRMHYSLDPVILEQIKNAREVLFRYYAGPDMMTVRMRGHRLRSLQKIL